ncbi:acetylornithine aminotransferase [Paraliobacillus quinghaiensis]|uniref:Acetylornithine aminotransferase n=1 Tax=Paraliobacillus quinghaiensis TaxID=470815 RepID=A0A917TWP0_9BACI|nr:acetylornithine transaminase [Paraliobacillus quinghaiensis]GGM41658.1 acetylornithine aminotransferase [Paraliobacillus quinghaiensis]
MSEKVIIEKKSAVMPTYNRFPIALTKGKGSYVWDDNEKKYLDYTAGIATCNLGHVPDVVKTATEEQLNNLWHCSNLYTIPAQEALAEKLVKNSSGDQVFFCNSGAEANEAAIKIARRYAQQVNKTARYEVVTFNQSFHGRTLATLSATGQEKIQTGFQPLMPGFRYLPYNDIEALEDLIHPETCAVMLELVQGEGGVIPAEPDWVEKVVRLCQENDVLVMVDEIQTGMGRTGTLFAYQQFDFEPDVISVAKGLGSGFPIGALIARNNVAKAFDPGSHGSTFGGNPLATTAGLATIKEMTETDVLEKAIEQIAYLWTKLEDLNTKYDQILDIRGRGFLIGIEISGKAIEYVTKARESHQLLLLVAGEKVIRILPPLSTTREEIDQAVGVLDQLFAEIN